MTRKRSLIAGAAFAALCGCITVGSEEGDAALASGIRSYEAGHYAEATRNLHVALDLGLDTPGRVRAHKYLAFIHCISRNLAQCRNEFRAALAVDPSFELSAAEAGHPIWGPAFQTAKSRR